MPGTAYDFVIVGAGSAGCVLASRLSEDPATTVLLLEAGGPDRAREIRVPAAFSQLFKSRFDWAYYTEEQSHLHGRRLYWPRGKVLGGSSSINAMIYIRGNPSDYNHWHGLGNSGWGFADVLPYFKKAENQERGASEYHGVGGPLNVADLRSINPLSSAFVEAGVEMGLKRKSDFNGPEQQGVGYYQVTQRRGKRVSAADAYLKPARRRPNLTIRTCAQATRVLFDRRRAIGVEFVLGGQREEARAYREVILCSGTVNSPHLLMLSGVGPGDHLKALRIPVVAELPGVGQNLQDHMIVAVAYRATQPVSLAGAKTWTNRMKYLLTARGPFTSSVAEAGAFVKTSSEVAAPDLGLTFGPTYYLDHGFQRPEGHGFTLGPTKLRPQSRGAITLRSANPFEPPAIQPNYFSHDADVRTFVEGIRLCRRLAQARAFDDFRGTEMYPGPAVESDAAIIEYLRGGLETLYHPVGTCQMGSDSAAVVDECLRVRGAEALRVVDASIMPTITSGNTNAPTIMISERAADLIRHG
ncbi:MAG TPA: choline dehydrogenase [Candidatus Acidoferrales bacterium]|nr:choline dehydrogenase [Candidatus Acidoferrales bacterium]